MSLRLTSEIVAKEILDAWLSSEVEKGEVANVEKISEIEREYSK